MVRNDLPINSFLESGGRFRFMAMYLGLPENLTWQKLLLSPRTSRFSMGQEYPLLSFGVITPDLGVSSAHAPSAYTMELSGNDAYNI